jgi:hypothetical protein
VTQAIDRRRHPRGDMNEEPARRELVLQILGTFREMPGLSLHINQAARLFGLQFSTCESIFTDLMAQGHLRRGNDGQYHGRALEVAHHADALPDYLWDAGGLAKRRQ